MVKEVIVEVTVVVVVVVVVVVEKYDNRRFEADKDKLEYIGSDRKKREVVKEGEDSVKTRKGRMRREKR